MYNVKTNSKWLQSCIIWKKYKPDRWYLTIMFKIQGLFFTVKLLNILLKCSVYILMIGK